ncbi:hypothetical protein HK098_002878 [Nowakowskiella sp. JEL0407]|nr:hypothetical protein HK098_002878 [Nowakowskiella sp. JEL0407]
MPNFTTTTENDKIVASVVFMSTMKKYFTYELSLLCGIPKLQILGDKKDWQDIRTRLHKLREYGASCEKWADILDEILGWITAFTASDGLMFKRLDEITPGSVQVELELDDNEKEYEAMMFAGHSGFNVYDESLDSPQTQLGCGR